MEIFIIGYNTARFKQSDVSSPQTEFISYLMTKGKMGINEIFFIHGSQENLIIQTHIGMQHFYGFSDALRILMLIAAHVGLASLRRKAFSSRFIIAW